MSQLDYTYSFNDIKEKLNFVQINNHRQNTNYRAQIAVNDTQFLSAGYQNVPARIADLVDIGVAVYAADRFSVRQGEKPCHIHLEIPVRCAEILDRQIISEQLQELLYWYTGDHWYFTFSKRTTDGRPSELQMKLMLPGDSHYATEVALWSGGLDSLAGLCNRLFMQPNTSYVLFGTGGNTYIQSVQQKVAKSVKCAFPADIKLIQVPLSISKIPNMVVNRDMRTRGFIFMLLGAACAYLQGQHTLYIYENGIGAVNLPFRVSEVGLDHARSVHPLSLLKMNQLVSLLLDESFSFCNPFLFWTKAQMCEIFNKTQTTNLIRGTVTCDRRHRQKPMQCGWCSSCLLRRQALAASNIDDNTEYVITHGRSCRPSDEIHLSAMLDQVKTLQAQLNTSHPWYYLSTQYKVLWEIVDLLAKQEEIPSTVITGKFLELYRHYVEEWNKVEYIVGHGLINNNEQHLVA